MAAALAHCGADVVISSRKADACELVAHELAEASGRKVWPRPCNVGHWDDLQGFVEDVYDEMGAAPRSTAPCRSSVASTAGW
jgi:NAD(P)-dependent dehydrogenase (short-subunit alcohol dehydrogenase family)